RFAGRKFLRDPGPIRSIRRRVRQRELREWPHGETRRREPSFRLRRDELPRFAVPIMPWWPYTSSATRAVLSLRTGRAGSQGNQREELWQKDQDAWLGQTIQWPAETRA